MLLFVYCSVCFSEFVMKGCNCLSMIWLGGCCEVLVIKMEMVLIVLVVVVFLSELLMCIMWVGFRECCMISFVSIMGFFWLGWVWLWILLNYLVILYFWMKCISLLWGVSDNKNCLVVLWFFCVRMLYVFLMSVILVFCDW